MSGIGVRDRLNVHRHDWVPFGIKLYNPGEGRGDAGRFYRVEDVFCARCGEVKTVSELRKEARGGDGEADG